MSCKNDIKSCILFFINIENLKYKNIENLDWLVKWLKMWDIVYSLYNVIDIYIRISGS